MLCQVERLVHWSVQYVPSAVMWTALQYSINRSAGPSGPVVGRRDEPSILLLSPLGIGGSADDALRAMGLTSQ